MNYRLLLVWLIIVILAGCSPEPKQMTTFQKQEDQDRFLKELDAQSIPYSLNEHRQIYYPVSYRDEVEAASEKLFGPTNREKTGVKVSDDIVEPLSAALSKAEIPFQQHSSEVGNLFIWKTQDNEAAMTIINKIMNETGT